MTALQAIRIFGPLTLPELARRTGSTVEAAAEELQGLRGDGLVEVTGRTGGYTNRLPWRLYDVTSWGRQVFADVERAASFGRSLARVQRGDCA